MTKSQVFAITEGLFQGPFASAQRLPDLRAAGITHILNVGESPNILRLNDGPFAEIAWMPIVDLKRIPDDVALACINTLHRMICVEGSRVFVHCVAGWNRSPTIVWLYFVACGLEPAPSKELISSRSFDAIPGHPRLVDDALIAAVQAHGQTHFLPHARLRALLTAELDD